MQRLLLRACLLLGACLLLDQLTLRLGHLFLTPHQVVNASNMPGLEHSPEAPSYFGVSV
jgi:hypothetical protein